jgi:hypothetical protein
MVMDRISDGVVVLCIGVGAFAAVAVFFAAWSRGILSDIEKSCTPKDVYEDENHTVIPMNDIPERHI